MKNKIAFLLLVLLIVFSIYPAMADVYNPDDDEEEVRDPYEADTSLRALIDESAEKATAENLKGYIDRKSTKIIDLLQYGSQPVLIIAFIICLLYTSKLSGSHQPKRPRCLRRLAWNTASWLHSWPNRSP